MKKLIISLDAMGGDHAPLSVIEGAAIALKMHGDIFFKIYGDQNIISPLIIKNKIFNTENYCVIHTDECVKSDDKPTDAIRKNKNSSMRLAITSVANGESSACVSSGNTGALMALSKLILKPIEGIDRPAITTYIPSMKDPCVLLDLGANAECSADLLHQFALMGKSFATAILGKENPRVGLLNIGAEALKGNDLVQKSADLLSTNPKINYKGFAEGDDLFKGNFDVIVTDGFTGNIALKVIEGTTKFIKYKISNALFRTFLGKIRLGLLLIGSAIPLLGLSKQIDPRRYNGAIMAGLNGISVKSHGSADKIAFANAISVARKLVLGNAVQKIKEEIKYLQ